MREFEVTITLKNNRLKQRRLELGLSPQQLAARAEISYARYLDLEAMRDAPTNKKGEWREIVMKLCDMYGASPDELFPNAVRALKTTAATRRMDGVDLGSPLLSSHQQRILASPEDLVVANEEAEIAIDLLSVASPRERDAIARRYGLDQAADVSSDDELTTFSEIGKALNVSRGRVGQLMESGLAKMREAATHRRTRATAALAMMPRYLGVVARQEGWMPYAVFHTTDMGLILLARHEKSNVFTFLRRQTSTLLPELGIMSLLPTFIKKRVAMDYANSNGWKVALRW